MKVISLPIKGTVVIEVVKALKKTCCYFRIQWNMFYGIFERQLKFVGITVHSYHGRL